MKPQFLVLLLLVATAVAAGGVAAQDNQTEQNNETALVDECTETVTDRLAICDADLDGSELVIDFYSDGPQRVTLTEAFRSGSGELNQRRGVHLSDGRNTVRLSVTVDGGAEGFTVAAGDVLYQREVTQASSIVAGPFTAADAQASGIGGALGVAITTLYLVARRVYGNTEEPERIA